MSVSLGRDPKSRTATTKDMRSKPIPLSILDHCIPATSVFILVHSRKSEFRLTFPRNSRNFSSQHREPCPRRDERPRVGVDDRYTARHRLSAVLNLHLASIVQHQKDYYFDMRALSKALIRNSSQKAGCIFLSPASHCCHARHVE